MIFDIFSVPGQNFILILMCQTLHGWPPRMGRERLNFLLITALSHYTIIILHKENHDKCPLDGERHKAVVLPDVPLEDVGAGAQHPLKPRPVQLDTPGNITNDCTGYNYVSLANYIIEKIKVYYFFLL